MLAPAAISIERISWLPFMAATKIGVPPWKVDALTLVPASMRERTHLQREGGGG